MRRCAESRTSIADAHAARLGRFIRSRFRQRSAQDGAQSGAQFAWRARFGHVIVRSEFEAEHPAFLVAFGGQHQHRQTAPGADSAKYLDPAEAGHHHVDDDDIRLGKEGRSHRTFPLMGNRDPETIVFQIGAQQSHQFEVIIDQ